jgi:hypothetical protein
MIQQADDLMAGALLCNNQNIKMKQYYCLDEKTTRSY